MKSVQGHVPPLAREMTECTLVTGTGQRHPPCEPTVRGRGHRAVSAWQERICSTNPQPPVHSFLVSLGPPKKTVPEGAQGLHGLF